jgi:hypothetical protein
MTDPTQTSPSVEERITGLENAAKRLDSVLDRQLRRSRSYSHLVRAQQSCLEC